MKEKVKKAAAEGAHDGYGGEPGTYVLKNGKRVSVDPETQKPLSEPEPEPAKVAEKTTTASEPAKKAVSDTNKE